MLLSLGALRSNDLEESFTGENMDLTKYEVARIIGARALQLSAGAPPMIKIVGSKTFMEVAQGELEKGVMPLAILKES